MISVYTDGSSNGRADSPGGYGFVIILNDSIVLAKGHGSQHGTTNNRQELCGIFFGVLEAQTKYTDFLVGQYLEVVSDSQYALGIASGKSRARANQDLVEAVQKLFRDSAWSWNFRWVKGHRKSERWNEMADEEANLGKKEAECLLSEQGT